MTGLSADDGSAHALVAVAALIAADAPPASYTSQLADALQGGVTAEALLGALRAIAPYVGGPKIVAAAPEIVLAMGLEPPAEGG